MKPKISILAHRGLWTNQNEKNSLQACEAALSAGFGVEVDVRDYGGKLVVAHDVGEESAYDFLQLAALLAKYPSLSAAINIKSCGLQKLLKQALTEAKCTSYFVFDMAVPDLLMYKKEGMRCFTRQSEYEKEPVLLEHSAGIWLDMFEYDWVTHSTLHTHLSMNKSLAIVSPELHHRPHEAFWHKLRELTVDASLHPEIFLCTDHPESAQRFFDGQ